MTESPVGTDAGEREDSDERGGRSIDTGDPTEPIVDSAVDPTEIDREFGTRGWILVGIVVLSFVAVPLLILLHPPGSLSYRFAFLILPLVPAVLLGIAAVWATTRP